MLKKTRNIALVAGALAAVSFGGSALAAAGAAPVQPTHQAVITQKAGDKETADGINAAGQKAGDTEIADGAQQGADTETADVAQGADTETADGAESGNNGADEETKDGAGAESENGSEIPGSDGPGGHAGGGGDLAAAPAARPDPA